ncbi:MAG: hypothetical protein K2X04_10040 [Burkholderiales bacterium]|nr:hypothetical protein [Burkholderiales bacterium]
MTFENQGKLDSNNPLDVTEPVNQGTLSQSPSQDNYVTNTTGTIITIREERVELILTKSIDKIISLASSWQLPLGISITLLTVILTVDNYKSFLGINALVWKTLIGLACLFAVLLTIYFVIKSLWYKLYKKYSINYIIDQMKK